VDGILTDEDAARKTRDIEAGPLLQTENMVKTAYKECNRRAVLQIQYQRYKKYDKECRWASRRIVAG
jgi:hypothetical protein